MKHKEKLFLIILSFALILCISGVSAENINTAGADLNEFSVTEDSVPDDRIHESVGDDLSNREVTTTDDDELSASNGQDLPTIDSGSVSGGVDIVATHPWKTTTSDRMYEGSISYDIPAEATNIKSAYVYVNIYSGSAQSSYGSMANISIKTDNGNLNNNEELYYPEGSTDGVIYTVNNHITKCYSDYMIFYNITDLVQGLNGTSVYVDVLSYPMLNKQFDGRIKLISIIMAYDDGDLDEIEYWINAGQSWTNSIIYTDFETKNSDLSSFFNATLTNIALSSNDGAYFLNNNILYDDDENGDIYISGDYYQYHRWNVNDRLTDGQNSKVQYISSSDGWGSFKNIISILTIEHIRDVQTDLSFKTEYENTCYAGTNNGLSITVSTNAAGRYKLQVFADGNVVNSNDVYLTKGENKILLIDPTVRNITESCVNGVSNDEVNYTVELSAYGTLLNTSTIIVPVLYNGYLGKDLAYPNQGYESFLNITINGDVIVNINEENTYIAGSVMNRTDIWNLNLDSKSNIVKSFVYVPYTWFNSKTYDENISMFDVKFNGAVLSPVAWYRDQSNLGVAGRYGYGVLVYDVTKFVNKSGINSFVLNKKVSTPAVYPSIFINMYNTTGSGLVKNIYIVNGADLLSNNYNDVKRQVRSDSWINIGSKLDNAKLYLFASSAQSGESDVIFNGKVNKDVWKGGSSSSDLYVLDISDSVQDSNSISFVATGSTILALHQIIVVSGNVPVVQPVSTKIEAPIVNTVYNTDKNFIATLKDSNGKSISNSKIKIVLNGVSYTKTTNSKGQITLKIPSNLVPKTHIVSISYSGDSNHLKSSLSSKIIVNKANIKLTANKKTFKSKLKVKKYSITLKNNKGKAMKKVKVVLKIKSKKYSATTNSKGKAIFKITKLTKKGKHDAKIIYAGNKYFKPLSRTVKITIKK